MSAPLGSRLLAEAIGTFFLVLIGPGAVMVDAYTSGVVGHVGISLAFAFVVTAMVYAVGPISGAHINPAVTIGLWSGRKFPGSEVVPYVAAQSGGAVAASAVLASALGSVGRLGATIPSVTLGATLVIEWLLSFALMFVILAVADDKRVSAGFRAPAIWMTVGFCALMAGPITGASMNPARSFGPAFVGAIWVDHWVYWVAPIAGMLSASWLHARLRSEQRAPAAVERGEKKTVSLPTEPEVISAAARLRLP